MANEEIRPAMLLIIDAHAHVYRDPPGKHAPWPVERFLELLDQSGVAGGVLVQPSFLGTNHVELLAALGAAPGRFRAVGVVDDSFTRNELLPLHDAGVRGIRLNFFRGAQADLTSAKWRKVLAIIEQQGWHLELNARDEDMAGVLLQVRGMSIPITVDHIGRPDPAMGVNGPGFKALLDAAGRQTIYLKLTAPFRSSMKTAQECVRAWLTTVGPHRALWGSDCPWVDIDSPPAYRHTLSWIDECISEPADKAAVLGGNARTLFEFGEGVPHTS